MITVQGFKGVGSIVSGPEDFLKKMSSGYAQCGKEAIVQPVGPGTVGEHKSFSYIMGCGKPHSEVAVITAFVIKDTVYVIQKAVRGDFTAANNPVKVADVEKFLEEVKPFGVVTK